MKLGLMQPYFFPYLGYWQLIHCCDLFILFDTPQYIQRGWINRNRILNHDGHPCYIIVPLKKASVDTAIKDKRIDTEKEWKRKLFGQLTAYKNYAPYYKDVVCFLREVLDISENQNKIAKLNEHCIRRVCEYLEIDTKIEVFSEMNIQIEESRASDEWALNVSKSLEAEYYVNPPGGRAFFHKQKYDESRIKLRFLEPQLIPYKQGMNKFENSLSIIDVMMFCGKEGTKKKLNEYVLAE